MSDHVQTLTQREALEKMRDNISNELAEIRLDVVSITTISFR